MYSALNEDYMFQEMKNRTEALLRPVHREDIAARRRTPLVAQGDAPCAMMTDVRMDRSRTESLVGRDGGARRPAPRCPGAEHTRMVLLSGDAGVGKTRLLTEALDRLAADGWRALVGHCLDFGETSMPYLPFAEMLAQVSAEVAPELVEQDLHPALGRLRHRAPADEPSEGLDRAEVFEAVRPRRGARRPRARSCSWSRTPTGPTPAPAT